MRLNNFKYGLSLLQTLYGIDMTEDQYEEIASIAFNLIGNKRVRTYRYSVCVSDDDEGVELPCNVDFIESITTSFEDFDYITNHNVHGNPGSAATENYIEHRKKFRNPLYNSGKLIQYEQVGNTLYFNEPYGRINILYRGEVLDEDGLPEITDKEATAIATYCAYITKYKEGLLTNNKNIVEMANTLKQQWNIQVDQARVDQYMTQNDWNTVLDAKTSWNRKQHNKSWQVFN